MQGLESLRERIQQSSEEARQGCSPSRASNRRRVSQYRRVSKHRRASVGARPATGDCPPGDARQFQREFGQRRRDAERLRDQLAREGLGVGELERGDWWTTGARGFGDVRRPGRDRRTPGEDYPRAEGVRVLGPPGEQWRRRGTASSCPARTRCHRSIAPLVEEYYRSLSEGSSN